ncbi:PucR family transcriptional regulator ligand-binding domain-containing protein [Neobacillus sp. WH10]|uniref:PucR family transcriptional regulator n=1 Tax=Neobacillus sp. WH10 TaxID=3047873 RepID=UPI0024C1DCA9|nr:PucR family transcriptional regulator [Neobacillus sp. WH10]WHY75375.1 PucR family transcriptional regulator ligand-binding domain-containing protein [Neobacillus sp. WH10]
MSLDVKLTVQEILENRSFKDAEVIAGKAGLHRTVKWIHIMEVTGIDELLNGDELILSTGIGLRENNEIFLSFFKQLIDSGAAGICIELGTYIPNIPEEIIELANLHDFPLIVFYQKVRFVDITQDLHTVLIKKHYQMISDLEYFSHQLNQLLLTSHPEHKILKFLHEHLKLSVVLLPNQGETQILSKKSPREQKKILQLLKEKNIHCHNNIAHQAIQALNQILADIYIISDLECITEYESLILDRTATALAQNTLRDLYIEERRKAKETEWIQQWLDGIHSEEQVNRYLTEIEPHFEANGCLVLLFKINQAEEENSDITLLKILFRSVFQSQGFLLLSTNRKNQLIFILLNKRKNTDWKHRMEAGIKQIQKALDEDPKFTQLTFGIGRFIKKLSDMKVSYRTAQEALIIQERIPNDCFSNFYEDLYIFRLVAIANNHGALDDFIDDYLAPVLKYDQQNNGKLLETLKVYLKCYGSKKETAANLFIVRQTLYQRLQKLAELLGEDFMESYKRQAIEFAINAYEYLSTSKNNRNS